MSITEVKQALGSWTLRLREDTPRDLLDALEPFGHLAVAPGRVPVVQVGDNLLRAARYVGVYRGTVRGDDYQLKGAGMAFWLGDEDGKGPVLTNLVTVASASFPNAVRALMPGTVSEGTLYSIPGTYTGTHQWETPRKALTYLTDTYSTQAFPASWRVNGDATLDAGRDQDLFRLTPSAVLVRKGAGRELRYTSLSGRMQLDADVEDYTTRVVLLAEGEGASVVTASASNVTGYRDLRGAALNMTRLISESSTDATNAAARAQLQLNRFALPRYAVSLSSDDYDLKGEFAVGDRIFVFDPDSGFTDPAQQIYWRGGVINPISFQVMEMTYPVPEGWSVGFRRGSDARWLDLTDYYVPESGQTTIKVGEFSRSLTGIGSEPVGSRPNGDTSTPATPVLAAPQSVAYQSAAANDVRAAVYLSWSTPLNVDGSTVLDGDHYEIRYRATQTFNYPITWQQAATFRWNELQSWGRPLSNPVVQAAQWITQYVAWGTNALTIPELMVAAQYEFQIRAVDGASPPNRSAYSSSQFHVTQTDTLAPDTPAVPEVTGSRIAIQVLHRLGAASGGTFNLASDLHHLEVHVGGPDFLPDASTQIGSLIANAGHLAGRIPVLATFPVENIDAIWVKVIAVDRFGNKSSPSGAVQTSATLIDSAHISDLTASKITAGTITAALLLSGSIKTAESGQRAELNQQGLQLFDTDGELTVNLTASSTVANFVSIQDGGNTLAAIDSNGNVSGQTGTFATDVVVAGRSFLDDYYDPLPKGAVAWGAYPVGQPNIVGLGVGEPNELGFAEVSFFANATRRYQVTCSAGISSSAPLDTLVFQLRDGLDQPPTVGSTKLYRHEFPNQDGTNYHVNGLLQYTDTFTPGLHRLLWTFYGSEGVGTMRFENNAAIFVVEDVGPVSTNVLVLNRGGATGGSTPPPAAVTTYTKTYSAVWSGSYSSSNGYISYYGNDCNQGFYSSQYGNMKSLIGFNYAQIRNDLNGATINKITFTGYASHWYRNSGGTAVIGTHNYGNRPGVISGNVNLDRQRSTGWPKPAKRTVTLPNSWGNEFRDGATSGITLGPGPDTSTLYYGRFTGAGAGGNTPTLTITYTK